MSENGFRFGVADPILNSRLSADRDAAIGLPVRRRGRRRFILGLRTISTPCFRARSRRRVSRHGRRAWSQRWTHTSNRGRCWETSPHAIGFRRTATRRCVTDAGRRNPAVTAQAAATLHLLTRGRTILGIGVGEREGNEPYGVEWTKPVARFEEAIATIRTLWDSRGELVSRDSPYFPLRERVLRPSALSRELAGDLDRRARPADAARHRALRRRLASRSCLALPRLRASARGDPHRGLRRRPRPDVDHSGLSCAGVHRTDARRRGRGARHRGREVDGSRPTREAWARHGAEHPLGEDFSGVQDLVPQTMDAETALSLRRQGSRLADDEKPSFTARPTRSSIRWRNGATTACATSSS